MKLHSPNFPGERLARDAIDLFASYADPHGRDRRHKLQDDITVPLP